MERPVDSSRQDQGQRLDLFIWCVSLDAFFEVPRSPPSVPSDFGPKIIIPMEWHVSFYPFIRLSRYMIPHNPSLIPPLPGRNSKQACDNYPSVSGETVVWSDHTPSTLFQTGPKLASNWVMAQPWSPGPKSMQSWSSGQVTTYIASSADFVHGSGLPVRARRRGSDYY